MIIGIITIAVGIFGGLWGWDKYKKKEAELKRVKALLHESLTQGKGYGGE